MLVARRAAIRLSAAPQIARVVRPVIASRSLCTAAASYIGVGPGTEPNPSLQLVKELERLESKPWPQSNILRLIGMFTDAQWQGAAAGDLYSEILHRSYASHAEIVAHGVTPDRYYMRLQIRGLHCWLAHARLREEPKERWIPLFTEMMEYFWNQVGLDLTNHFNMGFIQMSKHQKASQHGWHGLCRMLDEAMEAEAPTEAMAEVLLRNMYVDEEGEQLVNEAGEHTPEARAGARWLAEYLRSQVAHLRALPAEDVLKGRFTWADVQPPA